MFKKKITITLLSIIMIISTLAFSQITVKASSTNGWQQSGTTWNYYNDGEMAVSKWVKSGASWYLLNGSGEMQTGWVQSGIKWYYLNSSGAMAVNTTTPDGYKVDNNGVWIPVVVKVTVNTLDVSQIDFVSSNLTKTGANTATFQYKIFDKVGADITKTVLDNIIATSWVGSSSNKVSLDPLTGTGTVTYNLSDTDKNITVQLVYSNGIIGMSTFSLGTGQVDNSLDPAIIDFDSHRLTKTGPNTTTFNYRLQNKFGVDIIKSIPASQITASGSVSSTIALDPLSSTGTITYSSSSDVDKPITVSLRERLTGITVSSALATPEAVTESRKVSKITISTTKIAFDFSTSETNHIGLAVYNVYDQYGQDITNEAVVADNLIFESEVGTITFGNGLLKLTLNTGIDPSTLTKVIIKASYSTSKISTRAILTVIPHSVQIISQ